MKHVTEIINIFYITKLMRHLLTKFLECIISFYSFKKVVIISAQKIDIYADCRFNTGKG